MNWLSIPFRLHIFPLWATLILLLGGCASLPQQTDIMKDAGVDDLTITSFRIYIYSFAQYSSNRIEELADSIAADSRDVELTYRSLQWKSNSALNIYRSAFIEDPMVAYVDLWFYFRQMELYLSEGQGKDLFGPYQPQVLQLTRKLESRFPRFSELHHLERNYPDFRDSMEVYVRRHPINSLEMARPMTVTLWADQMGSQRRGLGGSVLSLEEEVRDLKTRINHDLELLTKEFRWQGELLALDLARLEETSQTLSSLKNLAGRGDTLSHIALRLTAHLDSLEYHLENVIASQGGAIAGEIERQRVATIYALQQERALIQELVTSERQAILDDIERQRTETLNRIDSLANRSIGDTVESTEKLVSMIFWRVITAGLVLVSAVVGGTLLLRFLPGKS